MATQCNGTDNGYIFGAMKIQCRHDNNEMSSNQRTGTCCMTIVRGRILCWGANLPTQLHAFHCASRCLWTRLSVTCTHSRLAVGLGTDRKRRRHISEVSPLDTTGNALNNRSCLCYIEHMHLHHHVTMKYDCQHILPNQEFGAHMQPEENRISFIPCTKLGTGSLCARVGDTRTHPLQLFPIRMICSKLRVLSANLTIAWWPTYILCA